MNIFYGSGSLIQGSCRGITKNTLVRITGDWTEI
jgi:hypothetical protein